MSSKAGPDGVKFMPSTMSSRSRSWEIPAAWKFWSSRQPIAPYTSPSRWTSLPGAMSP